MCISCTLCSLIFQFLLWTKTNAASQAMTTKLLMDQPPTHILYLAKQKNMEVKSLDLNKGFENSNEADNNDRLMKKGFEQFLHRSQKEPKIIQKPQNNFAKLRKTDDIFDIQKNTLENTIDEFSPLRNETNSGLYLRFKQSIPVLEPVRHLLNTVREGGFNHTTHFNKTRYQLVGAGEVGANAKNGTTPIASSAIETKAERDMVLHGSESTNFQLLDFFGSIGGMFWNILMNIKKWFAASSGNASAAFSGASI